MVRFVYQDGEDGARHEYELSVHSRRACVRDLATRLGTDGPLEIDGRRVDPDVALHRACLREGAFVRPAAPVASWRPATGATLMVVAGLAAGEAVPVPAGESVIGRDPGALLRIDLARVSRQHCLVAAGGDGDGEAVTVTDLGSVNGTDLDGERIGAGPVPLGPNGVLNIGGVALVRLSLASPGLRGSAAVPGEGGDAARLPFTRPPRPPAAPAPAPVPLPAQPRAGKPAGTPFSLATLVAPLLMGAASVILFRNLTFLLFTALTPLMMAGNTIEERWRRRRWERTDRAAQQGAVDLLIGSLEELRAVEIRRRHHANPDLSSLIAQAEGPGPRLWERRTADTDFLTVSAGLGPGHWNVPLALESGRRMDPETAARVADVARLTDVPVEADLTAGHAIGVVGSRPAAVAAARALLAQAVVATGPADLAVAVFTDPDRAADWTWCTWLPHAADPEGGPDPSTAHGPAAVDALVRDLAARPQPVHLLAVVDGAALLEGGHCPLRELITGPTRQVSAIVLTGRIPALCDQVLAVTDDGTASLERITAGGLDGPLLASGITAGTADRLGRALARHEDPEIKSGRGGLPGAVSLLALLPLDLTGRERAVETVRAQWAEGRRTLRAGAVLGAARTGPLAVDLDDDGPHALIAGTTGSGKSELLRTLIAGLALSCDPELLNLILIDFKGGGALDECAGLPHTVGLVTDLDEHLAARALRCLEAELRHREQTLRDHGVTHVTQYQRLRQADPHRAGLGPLPRLVVVIDEFATLAKALPGFVDSLVSVAQRGRSLGVHLILATQRPAGSVSDAIKNNVKLRIALRLETGGDSIDVIDSPAGATIGPRQAGRAFLRTGAGTAEPFQAALSSTATADRGDAPLSLTVLRAGRPETPPAPQPVDLPSDLHRIVDATRHAYTGPAPREVWPAPLPGTVALDEGAEVTGLQSDAADLASFALADDPDRQRRYPVGWDPSKGNLLIYGTSRAETSNALAALLLGLAARHAPDRLHLHLLDFGTGALAPLAGLPHAGAHIAVAEAERHLRTVRLYADEVRRRMSGGRPADRSGATGAPLWLLAIENLAALTAAFDKDPVRAPLLEELDRIHADGPAVGVHVVATADRVGAVAHTWASRTAQKVLLGLADPADYAHFDVPRTAVPAPRFGRGVVAANRREIQIGHLGDDLAEAVRTLAGRWSGPAAARTASPVLASPPRVRLGELRTRARVDGPLVTLPVGLRSSTLEECSLTLHEHEHALVAGPARSGRSGALHAFGAALLHTEPVRAGGARVVAYAPRRSPLRTLAAPATVVTDYAQLAGVLQEAAAGALVLLVDDAETVDDAADTISGLLSSGREEVHVVAAVRNSAARKLYAHWTQAVRASRRGVLLMPDWSDDGDLLGVGLPRTDLFGRGPGRGYLAMDDTLTAVQLAQADDREALVPGRESAAADPSRVLGASFPAGERDPEGARND